MGDLNSKQPPKWLYQWTALLLSPKKINLFRDLPPHVRPFIAQISSFHHSLYTRVHFIQSPLRSSLSPIWSTIESNSPYKNIVITSTSRWLIAFCNSIHWPSDQDGCPHIYSDWSFQCPRKPIHYFKHSSVVSITLRVCLTHFCPSCLFTYQLQNLSGV